LLDAIIAPLKYQLIATLLVT